jgi:hypothetical protein
MRFAWLVLAAPLGLSAPASAAIYKWIDESGRTVYSNRAPASARLAKEARIVVEDEAPPSPADAGRADADRRERELRERIGNLERQLQARQYAPPPAQYYPAPSPAPPSDHYAGYYPGPFYPGLVYGTALIRPFPRFVNRFPARPLGGLRHGGMRRR